MIITPFAGLVQPEENDPTSVDNNAFFEVNPTVIDQFLKIGAVTHRHDAHPALPNPTTAMTGSVSVSGGALPSSTPFFVTYTLVDAYGGETAAASALALVTPAGVGSPTDTIIATPDYTGGILPAGDYFYAKTYTDGAGGETPIGPATLVYVDPGFASAQVQISNLMADAPGTAVTARLWRSYEGADWHLVTETSSDTYTDTGFDPPDNPALPPETDNTNQTNLLSVTIPSDPAMTSACVAIRVYFSSDGGFPNPSFLEQVPTSSAGAVLTITSQTVSAGAPPPVSRASRGAAQINPDTDMLDFPWKRPVATIGALPGSGNEDGDVREALDTHTLYTWDAGGSSWQPVGGASDLKIVPSPQVAGHTLALEDTFKSLDFDSTIPMSVVIPNHADVDFDTGDWVEVYEVGSGQVVVTGDSGVTLEGPLDVDDNVRNATAGIGCHARLRKRDADIWVISGALASAHVEPPAVIVRDTFTDADSTALTSHAGEVGASWTFHPSEEGAPAPEILSNQCHRSDTGADTCSLYASGVPASPDYSVSVDFGVIGDITGDLWFTGVWGRLDPAALNGYLMNYVANDGTIYISLTVVVAGSFTDLGTHTVSPTSHTATLTMVGDQISVAVDGTVVLSFTDGSITAAGQVGVRIGSNSGDNADAIVLDNLLAEY